MSNHLAVTAIEVAIELDPATAAIVIAFLTGLTRRGWERQLRG